jgi:hypothetical protein
MSTPLPPESEVSFETKTLERLQVAVNTAISNQMLHGIKVGSVESSRMLEMLADRMVYQLRAYVWTDPEKSRTETHTFTYTKAHPSWRHALVASLPEGSFRRRFLHFFWDIPFDYQNTRVTETVEVFIPAVLPEMQMDYPKQFGRIHFPVSFRTTDYTESYYGRE